MNFEHDLEWTLRSPALLTLPECVPPLSEKETQSILKSARPPATPAHKLGRYFEQLVHPIAEHRSEQIFHSVVLEQGKETLGELDLVFVDPRESQITQHWEVAIKFYLAQTTQPALSDYLGPQGRDRLDLKLQKLRTRQLPLGQTPQARAWLAQHHFPTAVRSHLFVKGRLFYPADSDWRSLTAPTEIAPDHLRGWWSRAQIPAHFNATSHWVLLPKLCWISGILGLGDIRPLTRDALNARLAQTELPVGVAELTQSGGTWIEKSRGMIVPQSWPTPTHPI